MHSRQHLLVKENVAHRLNLHKIDLVDTNLLRLILFKTLCVLDKIN